MPESWKDKPWLFPHDVALAGAGNWVKFPVTPYSGLEDCCTQAIQDEWLGTDMANSAQGDQVKAFVLGNEKGQCCFLLNVGAGVITNNQSDPAVANIPRNTPQTTMTDIGIKFGDFGKTVSSLITIALVEEGLIKLDQKVAELLPWWTDEAVKDVTVMELLTLTSGMKPLADVTETTCSAVEGYDFTRKCAQLSYSAGIGPASFAYTQPGACSDCMNAVESSYYILAAIALETTQYRFYNDLFIKYVAHPLGLNTATCRMSYAYGRDPSFTLKNPTPGLGLECSLADMVTLWRHVYAKKIVKEAHHDLMETPYLVGTPNAIDMKSTKDWYNAAGIDGKSLDWGLGMFLLCEGSACPTDQAQRYASGALLTAGNARLKKTWERGGTHTFMSDFSHLWIWRKDGEAHWGMIVDTGKADKRHVDTAKDTSNLWDKVWPMIRSVTKFQTYYVWSLSTTTLPYTSTTTTWLRPGERCLFFEEETKECLVKDGEDFYAAAYQPSLSLTMALCTLAVVMMGGAWA